MAYTKIQTVTEADILEDGRIRGYMTTEWPDEQDVIDPEDTQSISKTFDNFADCPQMLKDFITTKTGLS